MQRILNMLLVLGILLGVLALPAEPVTLASEQQPPPTRSLASGSVVARVYFADAQRLNQLARELDIWEVHHAEGYLVALLSPPRYAALVQARYRVEVDEAKTALLNQPLQPLPGQTTSIPGYPCYRTVEETFAAMQALATNHPTIAQWIDIGDSWEKVTPGGLAGYDILVLKLTNQAITIPKPKFFLMAEIHAREYTTAELAARFAEYLVNNYGANPDITWLLDYQEVHILVMTNPDGRKHAETGDSWRKNTDNDDGCSDPTSWGTDLNRNSSFHWGGAGTNPCGETYQGPSAVSEPETQAMQNYVLNILPDQRGPGDNDPAPPDATGVFLTLHSYAQAVLFPWGWTTASAPNRTQLQTLGRKFGYFNHYEVCQSGDSACMYPTTGTSDDWAYGVLGVAAYTFEMGTSFFQDCSSFENTLLPNNLPALLYGFKAARRPYQTPAGPESLQVSTTLTSVVAGVPITLTAIANDTRYDSNGWGTEPTQNIAAARYTIDAPAWISGVISYPMSAADGAFNSSIETVRATLTTAGLAPGRHTLFVESQDAAGNWGVPSAAFLWVTAAPDSAIAGTVRSDSTGVPLEGATIHLAGGYLDQQQVTGPEGYFAFAVFSGTYALTATAPLYYPTVLAQVAAQTGMTTTQDITLTAIPSGTLAGFVSEEVTGFPLAADIQATSGNSSYRTSTDPATGFYQMTVLSDTYTVTAQAGSHLPVTNGHVTVTGWQTTTLDFALPVATCVLLVDDDGGRSYEGYFQNALNSAGITHQMWNVASQGSPSTAVMAPYNAVLWFTGDDNAFQTLTAADRANLTTYLQNGGKLFLTGTEVGVGNQNQSFYTNILSTQFVADDSESRSLVGGGPFAGVALTLNGGDGANDQNWPDAIAPRGSALAVFTYTNGLGGGVAVDSGTYRAINLGFGVEGIDNAADRTTVVREGLTWLGCPPLSHEWTITKTASVPAVRAGERLTYSLSFTHTSFMTATQVVITDELPAHTTLAYASEGGSLAGNVATWLFPEVDPTQPLNLTLAVTVTGAISGTSVVNTTYGVRSTQTLTTTWGQPVTVFVLGASTLAVSPMQLDVSLNAGDTTSRTLSIGNTGAIDLMWNLVEDPAIEWLDETPISGTVPPADKADVEVTLIAPATVGVYTTTLRVASNDPNSLQVDVPVTLTVPPACTPVSEAHMTFTPPAPKIGETVVFSGVITPPDATRPLTFTWSFGDGSASGVGDLITHAFPLTNTAQTYTVTMTATNLCSQVMSSEAVTAWPLTVYLPVVLK